MNRAVEQLLRHRIQQEGVLSVADFMATCLYAPGAGYYMTRDPFGREGDFTTAPEVSQLFGEMLAVWVADVWLKMNRPDSFLLVEGGPGRGTLMFDMLRTLRQVVPQCFAAAQVHMLEISPLLKRLQRRNLADFLEKISWHTSLNTLPSTGLPVVFVGNELLDAFPVNQYTRTASGDYKEVGVVLNDRQQLAFGEYESSTTLPFSEPFVEVSPARDSFLDTLKQLISYGAALFLDYGDVGFGNTLQAVRKHMFEDVLQHPGDADLTTHVNFAQVITRLGKNQCQYSDMASFLTELGLAVRARQLLQLNTSLQLHKEIEQQVFRLLHPEQMGVLFKVCAWRSAQLPPLAGFGVSHK